MNDDDYSDYFPSNNDNKEDIILSDPEHHSEENNNYDDNTEARDANDRSNANTITALFKSKSGVES